MSLIHDTAMRLLHSMELDRPYHIRQLASMSGLMMFGPALHDALGILRGEGSVETSGKAFGLRYIRKSSRNETQRCSVDGCETQTTRRVCCYCTWREMRL